MNNDYIQKLVEKLNDNPDILVKDINVSGKDVHLIYIKSMVDKELLTLGVFSPLISCEYEEISLDIVKDKVLKVSEVEEVDQFEEMVENITKNKILLFIDNQTKCLSIDIELVPSRQPTEPPTSAVIKGPREGFTENIKINIALLRKRLKTDDLIITDFEIGKYTKTHVSLCYLKSVADKRVVNKIKRKLKAINIDGIIDSYYILNFLEERPFSLFNQVGSAEKPDIISAKILEGRVAILVDNSPIVLTLPYIFLEDMQNSNDYYTRQQYTTYIRASRIIGVFIAVILPGVYLALRLYHYNLMPLSFLITIINSTQLVPFSPFIELLFILILFRLLYEVSLRLPSYLGLATSIVGALILGDTGVKAGLISPPGVMIIALSVIAVYVVPDQASSFNVMRLIVLLIGGGFGIFGVVCSMIFIVAYMNSLTHYGAPYLAPLSPLVKSDLKDAIMKVSLTKMKTRPKSFTNKNEVRQKDEERD